MILQIPAVITTVAGSTVYRYALQHGVKKATKKYGKAGIQKMKTTKAYKDASKKALGLLKVIGGAAGTAITAGKVFKEGLFKKAKGGIVRRYKKGGLVSKRTFIARGCGKVMNNRRKKTKIY
jgi:hypothetical protein